MSNPQNSYNKVSQQQQSRQGSPIYQYFPHNELSPFRKHLPIIPQSQVSPERKLAFLNIDGVIESQQYLGQSFQSRLYEQGQMKGSLMSRLGDSEVLSPKQKKILLNKIYQKQKQLVLLQDKLFMLKNTNQCLRDTIKQNNAQKDKLIEQLQQVKKQSLHYKQAIVKSQQQHLTLQQQQLVTKQTQQEKYFKQKNIMSKSRQQLIGENQSLQQSIRQMTAMYQREISIILEKHEQMKHQLQHKWLLLVQQKDLLLKDRQRLLVEKQAQMQQKQLMIQNQRDQMKQKMGRLEQQLDKVIREKKILLKQYLEVIQGMKKQMKHVNYGANYNNNKKQQSLKKRQITSQTLLPSSQQPTSQNILIQHQQSYEQQQQNHNSNPQQTQNQTVTTKNQLKQNEIIQSKLKSLQKQNQLMKTMIVNSCKQNNLVTELYSSRKIVNVGQNNNLSKNYYTQQLLSKTNSISSLKPVRDLNTSYIADRLNQTMISQYPQRFNNINNYSSYHLNNLKINRSTSKSRSNSRQKNYPTRLTSQYNSKSKLISPHIKNINTKPYIIKPCQQYTVINTSKIYNSQNPHLNNSYIFNEKLYQEIDNKLDQIKYQINKQITY